MKNRIILGLIIIFILALIVIVCYLFLGENQENINNEITNNANSIEQEILENNISNNQVTENINVIENTDNISNNSENNLIGESDNMNNQNEAIKINLIVNNKTFSATLENNATTRELVNIFPLTLNMSDLNSNEKYNYLDSRLTTNSTNPRRINAGDIKLYGSNCLVVFYESFNTSYSYTNLGKVDNVNEFVSELGRGSVNITFELIN